MSSSTKPVPSPSPVDQPYWDGLALSRLQLPRCDRCGRFTQRRQLACVNCGAEDFTWAGVSGRGTIYTYTVVRQTWVAGFGEEIPYLIIAVQLDDAPGALLTTNLVGEFEIDDLDIGLPVLAAYEERGEATVLQFELDRSSCVRP